MLRSAPVPLLVFDSARERLVFANRRAEAWLGATQDELAECGLGGRIAWEADAAGQPASGALRAALARAASGTEACCELGVVTGHGPVRRLRARFEPTFGAGPFVSAVLEEPPAAPQAEPAPDNTERWRRVLSSAREGFWDWDVTSGQMFLSEPWLEQLGYGPDELPGDVESWRALIHPDDRKQADAVVESRLLGRSPIEYSEYRLRAKSGHYRWFAARGRVVARSAEGAALRMVGTDTDITELRAAYEGLRRGEVERARSKRLGSVGMLAAGVAHEINNPLAYILNNLDFALHRLPRNSPPGARRAAAASPDPEALEALREAREGALRVREVVKDLRTFARAGSLDQQLLDVREVVEAALSATRNQIDACAQLVLSWAATRRVRGNRARLVQIFQNLLVNACEAIEPGFPQNNSICVAARDDGDLLEVVVRDTGIGIVPSELDRIFDLFYTTKPVGGGTGLGLSICHDLVEALGGSIDVQSEVGQWTELRVRLPGVGAEPAPRGGRGAPNVWQRAQRLLVVDDDPLVARSVRRLLGAQQQVTLVHDGPSALAELVERRYDIVLCDVMMPQMDGVSLLEAVRAARPAAARRFVFMTGSLLDPESQQRMHAVGAPCINKPLDIAELTLALSRVLDASEQG